jgi:DNA-binding YbaB/EbfC family protein
MLAEAQEHAESITVEGRAGGGAVVVTMTGAGDLESVKIDPSVVDPDDISMLEDLVVAAVRDAHARVDEAVGDPAGDLLAGLDLDALGIKV